MFSAHRAMRTITRLAFPRECGSKGEARARQIIADALTAMGVEARCEWFEDRWLEPRYAHLGTIDRTIAVDPAVPLLWLSPRLRLEKVKVEVTGRLAACEEAREQGCGQFIAVVHEFEPSRANPPGARGQLLLFDPVQEFVPYCLASDEPTPSAYVAGADRDAVLAALGEEATLAWGAERTRRRFCNLVAEIRGTTRPEEMVVMGAHLDSWPGTVGASDDAAGCAVVLEAARWFAAQPPDTTVQFAWFTGEELDQRGSRRHVESNIPHSTAVKLYVNLDGGFEQKSRSESYIMLSSEKVGEWVGSWMTERAPLPSKVGVPQASDAAAFGSRDVPVFWVTGRSRQAPHLPNDRPETIDRERLELIGRVSIEAAARAAETSCDL